jgi:hypothetical protein
MVTMGGPGATRGSGHPPTEREVTKRIEEAQKEPPQMVDYTLYFEDWREAGGLRFPHKIRRATAGTTSEEWTVTRVKVNPKIDPKKFDG